LTIPQLAKALAGLGVEDFLPDALGTFDDLGRWQDLRSRNVGIETSRAWNIRALVLERVDIRSGRNFDEVIWRPIGLAPWYVGQSYIQPSPNPAPVWNNLPKFARLHSV
jgi:hypothetical protein